MQISDLPTRTPTVFASSAGADYIRNIPVPSQIGIHDGEASYTDGFPPLTFVEEGAGGFPPDGRDMNGILNSLSAWARWQQAGGPVNWNSTFSTGVGGYPSGALVGGTTAGVYYINSVDNNTTNPNTGGAGWATYNSYLLANAALTGTSTAPSAAVNSSNTTIANTFYADRSADNALAAAQSFATANFISNQSGTVFTPSPRQLTIGDGTGGAFLNLNGAANTARGVRLYSAGLLRAQLILSGADNLFLQTADPAGGSLQVVFSVVPSTRVVAFVVSPTVPNLAQGDNSPNAANTHYVDVGLGNISGAFTGGNQNLAATGFQAFFGGFQVAWGTMSFPASGQNTSTQARTFNQPFPNVCLGVTFTANNSCDATAGGWPTCNAQSITRNGFTGVIDTLAYTHVNRVVNATYFAWGY